MAFATVAIGLTIHALSGGLAAGAPPFISAWHPRIRPLAAVSLAVLAAAVPLSPLMTGIRSRSLFAACAFVLALVLGLALNLAREGVHGWYAVFDTSPHGSFEAPNEYLPSLTALTYGPQFFLGHFAQLVPSLTINGAGHPPGLLLTMDALHLRSAQRLAAFCIVVGALSTPLAYLLARELLDEERARIAALFTAFAPSVLLDGTVSADAVYMTLGMATAALLVSRRASVRVAGAAMAAIGGFFSYLLLAIPVWAALVVLARCGWRAALGVCVTCGLAVLALNGGLALAVGYDPIGALRATGDVYRNSLALSRPYAYWVFGSPTAWGVMMGLPTAALALRAASRRDPGALALAAVVIVSAVLGFSKAETERIWLPYVPLACVAAASAAPTRLRPILAALAGQALLVEILLDTIW
ncbi:MAG TPA: hypothetical protein VHX88_10425 [Solirubrobacteraceae bacterium]|jgi:hypothetical protein|nr:hypothetical protein [Solirubrobacteraceae bacterium]